MVLFKNTIINFHIVYNSKWMDSIITLLKKYYNIVSLSDIKRFYYQNKILKNACHITFDDGDISFYDIVFPLLQKHNISASIYLSPKVIKDRENYWFQEIRGYNKSVLKDLIQQENLVKNDMSNISNITEVFKSLQIDNIWEIIHKYQDIMNTSPKKCMNINTDQLKILNKSKLVEIGAHTQNHPILKNESLDKVEYEIKSSVDELSEMLNQKVESFAYPNGFRNLDFDQREMDVAKSAGVKIAFSLENKSFNLSDDPFSIPRKGLTKGKGKYILLKLILGKNWDKVKRIYKPQKDKNFRSKNFL